MSTLDQIKVAYETFVEENEKFVTKGNKAAAGRVRKALAELGELTRQLNYRASGLHIG